VNNIKHNYTQRKLFLVFFFLGFGFLALGQELKPGDKIWEFRLAAIVSSPAIGSDGTIYVGSSANFSYLIACNPDGSKKWVFEVDGCYVASSPAIGSDGTIYVGAHFENYFDCGTGDSLYAINPDGSKKWGFKANGCYSSPAIGSDGTIYVGSLELYAINPDGSEKWAFSPNGGGVHSSPAIGSDGTIYVGSSDNNLYAINPDGTGKWVFYTRDNVRSSPAIGSDGIIYVGSDDSNLYAINPDGSKKWAFKTGNRVWSSPAIGRDGTVYVGSGVGTYGGLYAINPDGSKKWAFKTGEQGLLRSSPAIRNDGTIYIGSDDNNLYAINPDGSKKWAFETGDDVHSSPAIGSDGTIYVGSVDGNLYALKTTSSGPGDSPWPMFGHNAQRTGAIRLKPIITLQPEDKEIHHGEDVEFYIAANGTHPIGYQWYKNGKQIKGATDTVLKLDNLTKVDEAIYSVKITNKFGIARSRIAQLIVKTDPPSITAQPKDHKVYLGADVEFSVTATGPGILEYQWYKNGKQIKGATETVLKLDDVTKVDEAIYSVKITNDFGIARSRIAQLVVFYKHGPIELLKPNTTINPFTFTFIAKESRTYEVQASQDLKNWSNLASVKEKSGEVEFTDPRLPKVPFKRSYYRVKLIE
jgi:outer membrane protein assembly factor BamB